MLSDDLRIQVNRLCREDLLELLSAIQRRLVKLQPQAEPGDRPEPRFERGDTVLIRTGERELMAIVLRVNKCTLRVRALEDDKEYTAGKSLCQDLGVKAAGYECPETKTPWGIAESTTKVAPGITYHETSRHGGFRVDSELNDAIPTDMRNRGGWYEQDCEWCKVVLAFSPHFAKELCLRALERFKTDFPDSAARHASYFQQQIDSGRVGTSWSPFVPPQVRK